MPSPGFQLQLCGFRWRETGDWYPCPPEAKPTPPPRLKQGTGTRVPPKPSPLLHSHTLEICFCHLRRAGTESGGWRKVAGCHRPWGLLLIITLPCALLPLTLLSSHGKFLTAVPKRSQAAEISPGAAMSKHH